MLTVSLASLAALLAFLRVWTPAAATIALLTSCAASWLLTSKLVLPNIAPLSAAGLLALAIVNFLWIGGTHAEELLVYRDASSYAQTAIGLAEGHSTPFQIGNGGAWGVPAVADIPRLTLESAAFFEVENSSGTAIEPQFLMGAPAWYSLGYWVGSEHGMWWTASLFGSVGLLALGLLGEVLIGRGWGLLAATAIALCFPIVHTTRTTLSEPFSLFVLTVGLLLLSLTTSQDSHEKSSARRADIWPAHSSPAAAFLDWTRSVKPFC